MKKVYLYFQKYELGSLSEKDSQYLWTQNPDIIKEYNEKVFFAFLYKLNENEPTLYDYMPRHFREFVDASKREDLKQNAKIEEGDSDFEKLYKMATLSYLENDYYIKLKNED